MNDRFILGSKVNDISFEQALQMAANFLVSQKTHYIVTPNPEICIKAIHDEELAHIIKLSDLSIPDGFGLRIGALLFNQKLSNIIPGVDFASALFELCEKRGHSVLLIGGKGKTGTKALEKARDAYPNINVDYLNGGIFDIYGNSEYPDFIERINALKPDLILVNLGAPKQEYFMAHNKDALNTKLMIGVGGTIDFLSGTVKRAPRIINKLGFEWLYRLIQQPWRWKRMLIAVILFPLQCFAWRLGNYTLYRNSVLGFIVNDDEEVLIAKRAPRIGDKDFKEIWQLPHGGVNKGEDLEVAILREMKEELGLVHLSILDRYKHCYKYTWGKNANLFMPYKGQKQSIFLLQFHGEKDLVFIDNKEFTEYKWVALDHVVGLVQPIRQQVTKLALQKYKNYISHE